MDLITISNIIFKANVTSLVRCRMEQKVPNCISSCCWQFEMIQETKSSVYSADPTLTIIVFDLLTIGGAKLSSVVGLFFISHCGKCEDGKMKSAVSSDHSQCDQYLPAQTRSWAYLWVSGHCWGMFGESLEHWDNSQQLSISGYGHSQTLITLISAD